MNERQRETQQWLGSVIDGVFRLEQWLGETDDSAVFRTDDSGRPAVIKLIRAPQTGAAAKLAEWQAAAKLNHPHLVRILASGESTVKGTPVLYIVTEFSEETMDQVLAERPLTPTEARDVLVTALGTLDYLHSQGLTHGDVKASNFLAVSNKLKLSVDRVAPGDAADDVCALGGVFQNVLAKPLPQPFLDITNHAMDPDRDARWTIAEIATRLDGRMPQRQATSKPAVWRYVLPAAALIVAAVTFLLVRTTGHAPRAIPAPATAQVASPPASPAPAVKPEPENLPAPKSARERKRRSRLEQAKSQQRTAAKAATTTMASASAGSGGPLPEVPAYATRTIRGKVTIPVRVSVDAGGKVINAKVDSHAGSHYFAGFALKSAREWKFPPSDRPATWLLRFEFTRQNTKVSSARLRP